MPFWPESYLTGPAYVGKVLRAWSGPGWPGPAEVERYARWHKLQTVEAYRARRD